MRLHQGQPAPDFEGETMTGQRVTLHDYHGRTVLIKFYRFAACPICNLHIRSYVRRIDELSTVGVAPLVVFHSPAGTLHQRLSPAEVPFPVVADPEKRIFQAYGVEASMRGMFTQAVARDYARAMRAGIFSRPFGHEGGIQGHPADFLVGPDGIIRAAHYGRDYADTLTVDQVLDRIRSEPTLHA